MAKTKVKNTPRGQMLEISNRGKTSYIELDRRLPKKKRLQSLSSRKKHKKQPVIRTLETTRKPQTITGMPGGDKTTIGLTQRVSFLQGAAVGRRNFQLPMGYEGQEKILVVKSYAVGAEPKVYLKTKQDDNTIYTATKVGQVLNLICDGTYWYLLGTRYSLSGSEDPGEWTTN